MRRMELAGGSPRVEAKPIDDAAADYMKSGKHRLRSKTLVTYRERPLWTPRAPSSDPLAALTGPAWPFTLTSS